MQDAIDDVIAFAQQPDAAPARETLSQRMKSHDTDAFTRSFFQL